MDLEQFLPGWLDWIGRTVDCTDDITVAPAAGLAATLGEAAEQAVTGNALPPLWHWLYFLQRPYEQHLGIDGLSRGGLLPPVQLPVVMWAQGDLRFHRPLQLGSRVTRRSRVADIGAKQGRSGPLVFVQLEHVLDEVGGPLIVETQDIVFRAIGGQAGRPESVMRTAHWDEWITPNAVLLFRYSALTFNSHRIHYDQAYARSVEGFPDPVVQGPLLATLLAEALRRHHPHARLASFSYRSLLPLYMNCPIQLNGRVEADNLVSLWAEDGEGRTGMTAIAGLQPADDEGAVWT